MSQTVPAAIIYVNDDLSNSAQCFLVKQLFITQILDGYTFDSYVSMVPDLVANIHQFNQRILVIRSFDDFINRNNIINWDLADVVIFLKQGMAYILKNKTGKPGHTYRVINLNWPELLRVDKIVCECREH